MKLMLLLMWNLKRKKEKKKNKPSLEEELRTVTGRMGVLMQVSIFSLSCSPEQAVL